MVNRNGTATSAKATITAHFIYRENGTLMTVLSFVDDPAYFSEPLVRSRDGVIPFNPAGRLNAGAAGAANSLEIIDEITSWPKGYVPSYALGTKHTDWAESVGLPYEVSLGGAEQLYPGIHSEVEEAGRRLSGRTEKAGWYEDRRRERTQMKYGWTRSTALGLAVAGAVAIISIHSSAQAPAAGQQGQGQGQGQGGGTGTRRRSRRSGRASSTWTRGVARSGLRPHQGVHDRRRLARTSSCRSVTRAC